MTPPAVPSQLRDSSHSAAVRKSNIESKCYRRVRV
jgi:hypothetical protein